MTADQMRGGGALGAAAMLGYNALLWLLAPLWLALLWLRPRTRAELRERLVPLGASPEGTVWIHAASVGEIEGVSPVLAALRERGVPLRLTTMTRSGRERAAARFPGLAVQLAPLDLRPLVRASVRRARVLVLVLVETELWPNYLDVSAGEGVACAVVNARISDRTLRRYLRLRWLLARPLGRLSCVLARSPEDARRFVALGARAEVTRVIGDLKREGAAPLVPDALRRALGPGPLWVAGSTHPGEERALLEVWRRLRSETAPALRLVLVPRHIERAAQLQAEVESLGIDAALRSSQRAAAAPVVVLDTLGELAALYALAELVFVGGSLVPQGGHNLFEPLRAGKVSVSGPHLHNQRSQTELLAGTQALCVARDTAELERELRRLWLAADRHAPARAARERLLGGGRSLEEILAWIGAARAEREAAALRPD